MKIDEPNLSNEKWKEKKKEKKKASKTFFYRSCGFKPCRELSPPSHPGGGGSAGSAGIGVICSVCGCSCWD